VLRAIHDGPADAFRPSARRRTDRDPRWHVAKPWHRHWPRVGERLSGARANRTRGRRRAVSMTARSRLVCSAPCFGTRPDRPISWASPLASSFSVSPSSVSSWVSLGFGV
jgi:hypothetical protein